MNILREAIEPYKDFWSMIGPAIGFLAGPLSLVGLILVLIIVLDLLRRVISPML